MGREVELKLTLAENDIQRFLSSPLLKQARSRKSETLINHYYDTPRLKLHRKGIALRVRRQGRRWLQTVKCAGESAGGLSSRPEWEVPYRGQFDFSVVDAVDIRQLLERPKVRAALSPLFATDFRRITWYLEPAPSTALQLVLDRGIITAAGRQESICEVELELERGEVSQLFEFAQSLAVDTHLTPALLSKAERGFRLYAGEPEKPIRQTTPVLTPDLTPHEAFRRIGLACLEHLHANHDGAIEGQDLEYLHQMRIATRRLRAAMRLFGPVLPNSVRTELLPRLRELTRILGSVRDLDVLCTEIMAPAIAAHPDDVHIARLGNQLAEHQRAVRKTAVAELQAPSYGRLLLRASALLYGLENASPEDISLMAFTERRLAKFARNTRRLAKVAAADDVASLHSLRIATKTLRYGLEFCAPLLRRDSHNEAATLLARTQEVLGAINDLSSAGPHLIACMRSDQPLEAAIHKVAHIHLPRYRKLRAEIPGLLSKLRRLPTLKGKKKWT